MKLKITLLILTLVAVVGLVPVRADLTMVQTVEYENQESQVTVKLKGNMVRIDGMPMQYVVMNIETGDTFSVMAAQKAYVKMKGSTVQAAAANATENDNDEYAAAKFVPTGTKEKVGNYETEIYTMETKRLRGKYWVAKDYPNYAQIQDEVQKLNTCLAISAVRGRVPNVGQLPGMPVKSEIVVLKPFQVTIKAKLVSVNQNPIADDIFVIPSDYTQLQVPDMLNGLLSH